MGVCGDDYLVLGLCYVKGGEEGYRNEDGSEKGCGGGYVVSRSAYKSRIYGFCTGRWASFVVWDLPAKKRLAKRVGFEGETKLYPKQIP